MLAMLAFLARQPQATAQPYQASVQEGGMLTALAFLARRACVSFHAVNLIYKVNYLKATLLYIQYLVFYFPLH